MQRLPFCAFLSASAVSLIGNNLTLIAVPWFVMETTGSAAQTGLAGFAAALPAVIAAFFGGTIVDRVGYKRMSIFADLASGLTVAMIPLLYHTVGLQLWQLLLLVFFSALLDTPGMTARQALLPDVAKLTGTRLEQANAAAQAVHRGAMLVGPVIAGLLIVGLGTSIVLWLDAATFVVSAGLFALAIPAGQAEPISQTRYFDQLKEGLQFVRRDRLVLTIIVTIAITNALDGPAFAVLLPVYAKEMFGGPTHLGFMLSSFGAGAMLGALSFGLVGHRLPRRLTFIVAFVWVSLIFWVLAFSPPFPVVIAALLLGGLAAGPINPLLMTMSQERIPSELRGRVFGVMFAVALTAVPLGMVVAGFLAEVLTVTTTLLLVAASYLLVTVAQFLNPVLKEMDPEPGSSASPRIVDEVDNELKIAGC